MTRVRPWALGDAGAAVVDFVLVTVLLLGMFLLVFQVGVVLHVRNIVTASAAEGARFAAAANRTPSQGAARAQAAIADALGGKVSRAIRCSAGAVITVRGARVVDIVCAGRLPVVFGAAPAMSITVHGHAFEESR